MGLEVSGFNESIELKLCGSELLAGGIVQLASDAAALFILQGHEISGKPAQGLFGSLAIGDVRVDFQDHGPGIVLLEQGPAAIDDTRSARFCGVDQLAFPMAIAP